MRLLASALSLLFAVPAFAGLSVAPPLPPLPPTAPAAPRLVLDFENSYEFGEDSPAGPGGSIYRSRVSLPFFVPLNRSWRFLGALRGGWSDYESDPFGGSGMETWNTGGLVSLDGDFSETWSGTFGLLGSASWEDGASFSDSWNVGALALANYRFSPGLKVGLGAFYLTRQGGDDLLVPALGLDWQISERFSLKLYGIDAKATWALNEVWSVYLHGEFDPRGAQLRERKGVAAESFRDQGFLATGGLQWTPCQAFRLSVEGGAAFHKYSLFDDAEVELSQDRLAPAPFVSLAARFSF